MAPQDAESKKEIIVKTACALLAKYGFAKLTLDDIADSLGMKKSSLYYYYDNKDALLEDVMRREQERFFALIHDALATANSTFDKIVSYEKAKFDYLRNTIKLQEISTSILLEIKNKVFNQINVIHEKEIDMLTKILQEGIAKKEIRKCDAHRIAELILALSEAHRHRELYFASFNIGTTIDFSHALDEMMFALRLIFDGLAPKR